MSETTVIEPGIIPPPRTESDQAQKPDQQPDAQDQKPALAQLLENARQRGETMKGPGLREKVKKAYNKTRETYKKVDALTQGILDPATRSELTDYLREQNKSAKEHSAAKIKLVEEKADSKREDAIAKFGDKSKNATVAEKADAFVANTLTKKEDVKNFFKLKAENTKRRFQARRAETIAGFHNLRAVPDRINQAAYGWVAEKARKMAEDSRGRADQKREKAIELHDNARQIRGLRKTLAK